ncbi:uncharacterized protein LOC131889588 [Tigriopus californicus]|uniref:uncharacterized protein LOC131889588 n=1 Tax=Tigriopus californicus TaxID=6832 RepID=UPI0027DA21F5|nr:uncharacterized protein LOC131889588 [Tigriopus californicus]
MSAASAWPLRCQYCQSTFKVDLLPAGPCCRGFCRKEHEAQAVLTPATPIAAPCTSTSPKVQPAVPPAVPLSPTIGAHTLVSPRPLTMTSPSFKKGDYCRVRHPQTGVIEEATVTGLSSSGSTAAVRFLATQKPLKLPAKELLPSRGQIARTEALAQGQTLPAEAAPESHSPIYIVGSACRAVFSQDQVEYEGVVETVHADDSGDPYATIRYCGYNNAETVWLSDLLPSQGPTAVAEQCRAAQKEMDPAPSWQVGDKCRAVFSEDDVEYEGTIMTLHETDAGEAYGLIRFVGYENEETQWLVDLLPSQGAEAIQKQIRDSRPAEAVTAAPVAGPVVDPIEKSHPPESTPEPEPETPIKPDSALKSGVPLRNPPWQVGDRCRAIFAQDGREYEGELMSVEADQQGEPYGIVQYVGYNNEETQWLSELLETLGEDERKKQIEASRASTVKAEPTLSPPLPNQVEQAAEAAAPVVVEVDTAPASAETRHSLADKPVLDERPPNFQSGSPCRVTSNEDGRDYEATVLNVEEKKTPPVATVEIIGFDRVEHKDLSQLSPSKGEGFRRVQMEDSLTARPKQLPKEAPIKISPASNPEKETRFLELEAKNLELESVVARLGRENRQLEESNKKLVVCNQGLIDGNRMIQTSLEDTLKKARTKHSEELAVAVESMKSAVADSKTLVQKLDEVKNENVKLKAKIKALELELVQANDSFEEINRSMDANGNIGAMAANRRMAAGGNNMFPIMYPMMYMPMANVPGGQFGPNQPMCFMPVPMSSDAFGTPSKSGEEPKEETPESKSRE